MLGAQKLCCGSLSTTFSYADMPVLPSFLLQLIRRRIWKLSLPFSFSNRPCARWIAFSAHLLIISFAIPSSQASLTLSSLSVGFYLFFSSKRLMKQFFLELLRFLFLNFQMRKPSLWSFLLQELKLALDYCFGKENTKSRIFINRFFLYDFAFAWIQVDQGLLYLSSSTELWSLGSVKVG